MRGAKEISVVWLLAKRIPFYLGVPLIFKYLQSNLLQCIIVEQCLQLGLFILIVSASQSTRLRLFFNIYLNSAKQE